MSGHKFKVISFEINKKIESIFRKNLNLSFYYLKQGFIPSTDMIYN